MSLFISVIINCTQHQSEMTGSTDILFDHHLTSERCLRGKVCSFRMCVDKKGGALALAVRLCCRGLTFNKDLMMMHIYQKFYPCGK